MDDPISRSIRWVVIGLCILLRFFFSSSETSLSCCNRFKIQLKADEGKFFAKLVIKISEKFDRALTTMLIGSNIAGLIASILSVELFTYYLGQNISIEWVALISSCIIALAIFIIGDIFPKAIAKAIPDTISYINAIPLYGLLFFFTYIIPITLLFEQIQKLVERIFKVKKEASFTEDDFEDAVDKITDEGVIEEEQSEIIQSALDFVDTNVKEVFTPKDRMFALDIQELDHEKLKKYLLSTKYSRIPVYDTTFNNIIGILHVKKYFKAISVNPNVSIKKILQKPYFVYNSIMIDDLFNGFKKNHTHIAIVRNSNKSVVGMVTMEDVLEELVSGISEQAPQKEKEA